MAYSYVQYSGDGSTTTFGFGFPYIAKEHIKVLLNDVPTTGFTFLSANTVQIIPAPAKTVKIEIRRETAREARLVDFADGSVLTERDLDLANAQAFYLTQEAWDRSDVVIARANLSIDAAAQAKVYAELAFKYERLADDHKENALDADDRAKAYKEIAGTFAETVKTAAVNIENDRAEVSANTDIVLTAKTDVLIAKGVVESQAQLANAILQDAQAAAQAAATTANSALATANAASVTANSLTTTINQVSAQQAEALAARDAAVSAKAGAEGAASASSTSAQGAAGSASAAAISATDAATSAAQASTARTAAETAQTGATNAKTSAETAKAAAEGARDTAKMEADRAVAAASSIDVSNKADVSYVDTKVAPLAAKIYVDAAVAGREATIAAGSAAQFWRGDKTWQSLNSAAVGLGNVNNTSDTSKPVSTAQQAALDLKAPVAAPAFTGRLTYIAQAYKHVGVGNLTGTVTLDCTAANEFWGTITGATTFAFSNPPNASYHSQIIYLRLTNPGAFSIGWPGNTKFVGGSLGTLTAAGIDLLGVKYDYVNSFWWVFVIGKDIK